MGVENQEDELSFVDLLAFFLRHRFVLVGALIIGLVASAVIMRMPPNVIPSLYTTESFVKMDLHYHRIPGELSSILTNRAFQEIKSWEGSTERITGLLSDTDASEEIVSMLASGGLRIREEEGMIIGVVRNLGDDEAQALLRKLVNTSTRRMQDMWQNQAESYVAEISALFGIEGTTALPENAPPEVASALLKLKPYLGRNIAPYGLASLGPETIKHDKRKQTAFLVLVGTIGLALIALLVYDYGMRVSRDRELRRRIRDAWDSGRIGKKKKN